MSPFEKDIISYQPRLYMFALHLCRDRDMANDLVQNTFLRALMNKDKFKEGTNLLAWLFTICRNSFLTSRRKKSFKNETHDPDDRLQESMVQLPNQTAYLELREFEKAFSQLNEIHKEAIWLVAYQGLTYEEAAEEANTTVGTMKSRVSRARSILEKTLGVGIDIDEISVGVLNHNDNNISNSRMR